MKRLSSRWVQFGIGALILVVSNAVVLSGVAFNRSGEPESRLTLTERELELSHRRQKTENTGRSLQLDWRSLGREQDDISYYYNRLPAWFDRQTLEALGFDIEANLTTSKSGIIHFRKTPVPKAAYIVLEYDGRLFQESLGRAEKRCQQAREAHESNPNDKSFQTRLKRAEDYLAVERQFYSRLFTVDAGGDPKALRAAYPDRSKFIIAKGTVVPRLMKVADAWQVVGDVESVSSEHIHVPLEHRPVLEAVANRARERESDLLVPRYAVELVFGKRLEPWISSVHYLQSISK